MKPSSLLKAASMVALLQGIAHGGLVLTAKPSHGPREAALIDAMQSQHFDFLGWSRTYWGFYLGYGLMVAFVCVIEAALFWQLARLARSSPAAARPVAGLFCLANVGFALIVWRFFFFVPIVPDLLIAALLGVVFLFRPEAPGRVFGDGDL